jgi:hypothetical protein
MRRPLSTAELGYMSGIGKCVRHGLPPRQVRKGNPMSAIPFAEILAASVIAAVHVFSPGLRVLDAVPRRAWLSAAGGIALAYVFLHLLPELAEHQVVFATDERRLMGREIEVFLLALVGLLSFYGLERMVRLAGGGKGKPARHDAAISVFSIHVAGFVVYNALVGYLLVHRDHGELTGLWVFTAAMAVHFLVNDRALYREHGARYLAAGRWLLASAVYLGLVVGLAMPISDFAVTLVFAFLAGAIILNVMKEELPEERESAYAALVAGAAGYAVLLMFI